MFPTSKLNICYERIRIYSKDAIELANTKALGYFVTKLSRELTKFKV